MAYGTSTYGETSLGSTSADTPTLGTDTATAQATGSQLIISGLTELLVTGASASTKGQTINVSGTSTLDPAPAKSEAIGQIIFIEPDFGLLPAKATGKGETANLSGGTATLETAAASTTGIGNTLLLSLNVFTEGASASATGSQNIKITPNIPITGAAGSAAGDTASLSGSTTVQATSATSTGAGETGLKLTPNLFTNTAQAAVTGETGLVLVPNLITETGNATATGQEIGTDVIANGGEITVLIDGQRINTYTNIEAKKRLNEVDTFTFEAFIEEDSDRQLIQEGAEVKIIESYQDLLFKGVLNEVEYKSNFRAKCEGNGMVQRLLDRKTNRDTYNNSAGDDIVKSEVPETVMDYGTIETAPQVSVRFDHDNLARAVAGVANATAFDWYIDQDLSDDFDTDYLNFVEDAGRDTVQQTFAIGNDAMMVERNKDEGFIANDITLLGRGDGVNQLEANVFAASTAYTDTTQIITETETGTFTVEDATQLGSVGDNIIVRTGIEVMDVDIQDSTTLSINSRAQPDWESNDTPQIRHYEGVRVWRVENVTTGVGRFTPESRDTAEDGSSVEVHGVKEQRETDKTIVDLSTLEKAADIGLKNRFEDVFRVQIEPTDPRATRNLQLGDPVDVQDLTAMDVDDTFEVVGMDVRRNSSEEGTVLHLANRPRRLTERLSEMESNTDTLNAHMQGATNIDSQSFSDNCNTKHPLDNSIYVPSDVVKVNKFQLTFKRESFRGYVLNKEHKHDVEVNIPDHSHTVTSDGHSHDFPDIVTWGVDDNGGVTGFTDNAGLPNDIKSSPDSSLDTGQKDDVATNDHNHNWLDSSDNPYQLNLSNDEHKHSISAIAFSYFDFDTRYSNDTSTDPANVKIDISGGSTQTSETTLNAGTPEYGIHEPDSEAEVDVDIVVDGTTVDTVTNVSVGDELTDELALKQYLDDPIEGTYHTVKLVPTGRCRLQADVFSKVFIESTI